MSLLVSVSRWIALVGQALGLVREAKELAQPASDPQAARQGAAAGAAAHAASKQVFTKHKGSK